MAQLFQMRVRMKNLLGVMEGGSIPALSNLEESLQEEQKVNFLNEIRAHTSTRARHIPMRMLTAHAHTFICAFGDMVAFNCL